jgi:hypothetical protein
MKKIFIVCLLFAIGCQDQKSKFFEMALAVEDNYKAEIPNVSTIDTIYLEVDTITAKKKAELQAKEYDYALLDLRYNHKIPNYYLTDSAITDPSNLKPFEEDLVSKRDHLYSTLNTLDSVKFICFLVHPVVIVSKSNMVREAYESFIFMDNGFRIIPKEKLIEKITEIDYSESNPVLKYDYPDFKRPNLVYSRFVN